MITPEELGLEKLAYSVKETEALLSLRHTTLYEALNNNKLKAIKVNTNTLMLAIVIAAVLSILRT
jgi:hypothetical protein